MVNVTPAKYTVQIGPTMTPETAGELAAWAELRGVSVSVVARECLEAGLARQRAKWAKETGGLDAATLDRHTDEARARGERQVKRRKAYDDKTRGKAGGGGEDGGAGSAAA